MFAKLLKRISLKISNDRSSFLLALGLGTLSIFTPISTQAAERLTFSFPPFGDFYIQVNDLELFAEEGIITDELAYLTNRLSDEQLKDLKDLLSRKIEMSPTAIYEEFLLGFKRTMNGVMTAISQRLPLRDR